MAFIDLVNEKIVKTPLVSSDKPDVLRYTFASPCRN